MQIQTPSLVLPTSYAAGTGTLASTETVADLVTHTSVEFSVDTLQEKTAYIMATEVAVAAVSAGNLWCWVEVSPYPTANNNLWAWPLPRSASFWSALAGGGGGVSWATLGLLPPVAPHVEVTGLAAAAGTLVHAITLSWEVDQPWARVVIQTPVAAALPAAFWVCQVLVSAKY